MTGVSTSEVPRTTPATPGESARILVVDDEKVIREILTDFLMMEGFLVRSVEHGEAALEELGRHTYNMVICDLKMPHMGGLELLDEISRLNLNVITVIMTGFGTVETAIEAMKKGAYEYILKPFKIEEVARVVRRGLEHQRLQQENLELQESITIYRISEMIAHSIRVDEILDFVLQSTLDEVKADVVTLLIQDPETGQFVERMRKYGLSGEGIHLDGVMNFDVVMEHFRADRPLLVHGLKALRYFRQPPDEQRLVSFCSVPLQVQDRLFGMVNAYSYTRGHRFSEGQRRMLSVLAARAAMSLENARLYEDLLHKNDDLSRLNQSLEENFRATIIGFAHALEESDRYTRGHSERVSFYARLIAEGLAFNPREVQTVVQAGLMHDIGKIGIRTEKLNKPGKLTAEEMAMFRTHPAKGKRILEPIPFMTDLIPGVWCHHENWDGSGYPRGLQGDGLPILGRIIAVGDAYDAMTSDRAYRKALPHEVAVHELVRCTGTQFDPVLVPVFVKKIDEYRDEQRSAGVEIPR